MYWVPAHQNFINAVKTPCFNDNLSSSNQEIDPYGFGLSSLTAVILMLSRDSCF